MSPLPNRVGGFQVAVYPKIRTAPPRREDAPRRELAGPAAGCPVVLEPNIPDPSCKSLHPIHFRAIYELNSEPIAFGYCRVGPLLSGAFGAELEGACVRIRIFPLVEFNGIRGNRVAHRLIARLAAIAVAHVYQCYRFLVVELLGLRALWCENSG